MSKPQMNTDGHKWAWALGIALLALLGCGPAEQAEPARPNFLIVLTDDQGWGDLSLNGNRNLSTPNVDSLARAGARFDRFYVCPVCSPTRAEFLTGRYHPRGGVYSTSAGGERLDLDEQTIGDAFLRTMVGGMLEAVAWGAGSSPQVDSV